jgi:hypothetical protein
MEEIESLCRCCLTYNLHLLGFFYVSVCIYLILGECFVLQQWQKVFS